MAYHTDQSGCTLSDEERMDEARRILRRIDSCTGWEAQIRSADAQRFLHEKLAQLDMFDSVGAITVKQLYYLRDLSAIID